MKLRIITLIFLFLSGPILAQQETFIVESEITIGNKLIGSPVISLASGKEARISVQDSYDLALTATAIENSDILVSAELTVGGETVSPRVLVRAGQEFGMGVGDVKISMIILPSSQDGT